MPPAHFGTLLKRLRTKRRIKMSALAEKAGITEGYLSHLENNERKPSQHTFSALADGLELSPEEHFRYFQTAGVLHERMQANILRDQEVYEVLLTLEHASPEQRDGLLAGLKLLKPQPKISDSLRRLLDVLDEVRKSPFERYKGE